MTPDELKAQINQELNEILKEEKEAESFPFGANVALTDDWEPIYCDNQNKKQQKPKQMNWFDDFKKEYRKQNRERPIDCKCPECEQRATMFYVKKEGRNKGRPMLVCKNKHCGFWKWMDLPNCDVCGQELYEAVAKGGKNKGKAYQNCPSQCLGSFRWKPSYPKS